MQPRFLALAIIIVGVFLSPYASAKTTLITAATGSFGKAISFSLASQGYDLVLAGRNQEKLKNLKKEIQSKHSSLTISTIIIDFSDIEGLRSSIKAATLKKLNSIVLIGPRPAFSRGDIPSPEEWTKNFKETFVAPLETLKQLLPSVQESGSIVVISGSTSANYLPGYPNTNVIRLSWTGEVKNLMHFVAPKRIRVNAISPGPILTQHHRSKITKEAKQGNVSYDERMKQKTTAIPLRKYGSLDDVANLVGFLISEKSNHMNGSNIVLDGGQSNTY